MQYLTPNEKEQLLRAVYSEKGKHRKRNIAIFEVGLYCALRASEIKGLKVNCYDSNRKTIFCYRLKGSRANTIKIVDLHVVKALEDYLEDLYLKDVETVVLLSKGEVDSKKIRVEFSLEDMDMSEFQDGATYTQITEYVLEHSGLKVSNLYISQIKRKCGIEVGKNYNLPKSEDSRQPMCPPEKEKAIREAFKYFGMI